MSQMADAEIIAAKKQEKEGEREKDKDDEEPVPWIVASSFPPASGDSASETPGETGETGGTLPPVES